MIMISNANWHGLSGRSVPIPKIGFSCVKPFFWGMGHTWTTSGCHSKEEGDREGKNL